MWRFCLTSSGRAPSFPTGQSRTKIECFSTSLAIIWILKSLCWTEDWSFEAHQTMAAAWSARVRKSLVFWDRFGIGLFWGDVSEGEDCGRKDSLIQDGG